MQEKRHPFIAFFGGIGAGKTTATQLVAKHLGFHPVFEEYEDNPFLTLFYADMKRWALLSQTFFLNRKASQLLKIQEILKKKPVVMDSAIYQELSFADAQRTLGIMRPSEHKLYADLHQNMRERLPDPDLLIYLKTTLSGLSKRIQKRGRVFEQKIAHEYLAALSRAQEEWVQANRHSGRIIIINTEKLNFADNAAAAKKLTDTITVELKKKPRNCGAGVQTKTGMFLRRRPL